MIIVHRNLTAYLLLLYTNLFLHATGFGLPSPADIHAVLSSLDSVQHLNAHFTHLNHPQALGEYQAESHLQIKDSVAIEARGFYNAVRQAVVPKRVDNALAGIFAESASGAIGALLSRKVTVVIGEGTKRDSLQTKMTTTGAFFGARVGTEGMRHYSISIFIYQYIMRDHISELCYTVLVSLLGLSRVLGIPRPIGLLLAAVVGSLVSTTVKAEGRIADQSAADSRIAEQLAADLYQKEYTKRATYYYIDGECIVNLDAPTPPPKPSRPWSAYYCYDGEFIINMDPPPYRRVSAQENEVLCADTHLAHKPETMSLPELAGDICKWMTYDNLVVNWTSDIACWTNNDMTSLHVLFGSLAAIAGRYVQDITPSNKDGMETDRADKSYVSYSQTALEGGVLFGTYRSTLSFLNSVVPDDWNKKFLFHSCLENIEKMLPEL